MSVAREDITGGVTHRDGERIGTADIAVKRSRTPEDLEAELERLRAELREPCPHCGTPRE